MIDINKKYRTRDGREVRIYATDGGAGSPVMGAVFYTTPNGQWWWESARWTEDGRYDYHGRQTNTDLVEVLPRQKVSVWTNIYRTPKSEIVYGQLFHTKEVAEQYVVRHDRIACIKIDLDFEEGEGL